MLYIKCCTAVPPRKNSPIGEVYIFGKYVSSVVHRKSTVSLNEIITARQEQIWK